LLAPIVAVTSHDPFKVGNAPLTSHEPLQKLFLLSIQQMALHIGSKFWGPATWLHVLRGAKGLIFGGTGKRWDRQEVGVKRWDSGRVQCPTVGRGDGGGATERKEPRSNWDSTYIQAIGIADT
jgi:hypothetical protein